MRIDHGRCKSHLNKIILASEEVAESYIRANFPLMRKEVYQCPVRGNYHFHIRDKQSRNRAARRKAKINKRKRVRNED